MKEIKSLQNSLVKHLVKLRKSRSYRSEQGSVVLAGKKLVGEICATSVAITLFVEEGASVPENVLVKDLYIVSNEVMKKVSGLETPESVLAEVNIPSQQSLKDKCRILVFDGVSDPGNMGTLWRTALALGWDGAFILDNCVDPYNDKTLRSAKGATFRLPYCVGNFEDFSRLVEENQLQPLVGDIQGKEPGEVSLRKGVALVLGNEASGPSSAIKELCESVTIPMDGEMESLNVAVAGGILMYLLKKEACGLR
ncbi:MAG: TrmH family RNA methyltransferase [Chlamydiales bacterium]|jgi:TrmH family RNA methyltransferase